MGFLLNIISINITVRQKIFPLSKFTTVKLTSCWHLNVYVFFTIRKKNVVIHWGEEEEEEEKNAKVDIFLYTIFLLSYNLLKVNSQNHWIKVIWFSWLVIEIIRSQKLCANLYAYQHIGDWFHRTLAKFFVKFDKQKCYLFVNHLLGTACVIGLFIYCWSWYYSF